eukprot:TRINITY_DN11772_c0_g1_i2.p1 TRINITY_DN11772_c0_g1~~TRINITY_DN11772_c0_g1_i2.p1  ORF type:complete len:288 (-),score=74.61 TRINITY_DN11772_c0_g1_i2:84-947(-)
MAVGSQGAGVGRQISRTNTTPSRLLSAPPGLEEVAAMRRERRSRSVRFEGEPDLQAQEETTRAGELPPREDDAVGAAPRRQLELGETLRRFASGRHSTLGVVRVKNTFIDVFNEHDSGGEGRTSSGCEEAVRPLRSRRRVRTAPASAFCAAADFDEEEEASAGASAAADEEVEAAGGAAAAADAMSEDRRRGGAAIDEIPSSLGAAASEEAQNPLVLPGSALHGSGACKPCGFFWKASGCHFGRNCHYCHLCPEGELKLRKKAKVASLKMASFGAAAPSAPPASLRR